MGRNMPNALLVSAKRSGAVECPWLRAATSTATIIGRARPASWVSRGEDAVDFTAMRTGRLLAFVGSHDPIAAAQTSLHKFS